MAENSPVNILLADADLKITYANPASINTLRQLQDGGTGLQRTKPTTPSQPHGLDSGQTGSPLAVVSRTLFYRESSSSS